jgi:5-methylcytosine-specific restriction endonuclease McrA
MTYSEQLKHPLWQKKRLEILSRDNFRCTSCDTNEVQLNVHHGYYDKLLKLWEYDNKTLHTFCLPCHAEAHVSLDILKEKLALLDINSIDNLIEILDLIDSQKLPRRFILRQIVQHFGEIYNQQVSKYPF